MPAARITITLPEALVERIDRLERTRSRFIADAVEREGHRRLQAELRRSRADVVRGASEYYLDDVEDVAAAVQALQEPAGPVLDWDSVRRELLGQE